MSGRGGDRKRKRGQDDYYKQQWAKAQKTISDLESQISTQNRKISISNGTYFALIDDVFQPKTKDHYLRYSTTKKKARKIIKEVCRSDDQVKKTRKFQNGTTKRCQAYKKTFDKAQLAQDAATGSNQSQISTLSSKKNLIWKNGIFGEIGDNQGQIAHLVPASKRYAETYWFVTHFLYGYKENRSWDEMRRLIHGTNNARGTKIANTGIKHSVPNKIILAGQAKRFDNNPNVLIIPILSLEQAKDWTGDAYDAIVLIDAFEKDLIGKSLTTKRKQSLKTISDETHFGQGNTDNLASKHEVETALELTKKYTNAIIAAHRHFAPLRSRPIDSEGKPTNLVGKLYGNTKIKYNDPKLSWKNEHKVRKIHFTSHVKSEGHPAPDPILLVTRAAVQLQRRQGLLIAAEPQDDDDDNDDNDNESADLSALAEDEYLEKRRQLQQCQMEELLLGREIEIPCR